MVTAAVKLKRHTYALEFFSEIIIHDREGGIQINKKIFADQNLIGKTETKPMSGNICT